MREGQRRLGGDCVGREEPVILGGWDLFWLGFRERATCVREPQRKALLLSPLQSRGRGGGTEFAFEPYCWGGD